MKPNSKIGHASDNLERFTDIVLRHSTNFQKLLNVAKSVHFKMLKHCKYSTIYRHVKKKVLINAKIQTYLSNPKWLLFIYNLGGRHLNMELNLISAYKIHFI